MFCIQMLMKCFKRIKIVSYAVEVCGGKVEYCSGYRGCNRVRVASVNDRGERQLGKEKGGAKGKSAV